MTINETLYVNIRTAAMSCVCVGVCMHMYMYTYVVCISNSFKAIYVHKYILYANNFLGFSHCFSHTLIDILLMECSGVFC